MKKVDRYCATWNVSPDSQGPAWVEGAILDSDGKVASCKLGLNLRHVLALRDGRASAKVALRETTTIAMIFAADRGKDMVWQEDFYAAEIAVANGVTLAKVRSASPAAIRKVEGEILRKTTISQDAQKVRRTLGKDRATTRKDQVQAEKDRRKAERAARKAEREGV